MIRRFLPTIFAPSAGVSYRALVLTVLSSLAPLAIGAGIIAMPASAAARPLAVAPATPVATAVKCQCYAILASKEAPTGARVPTELAFMSGELGDDQFAAFKSFRLLEDRTLTLTDKTPQRAEFRSQHRLQLSLLQTEGKRLKLHINLQAPGQSKAQVDLDAWMASGGLLLFVGGSQDNGKIIFATRCQQ